MPRRQCIEGEGIVVGSEFGDDPDASWQYPGAQPPDHPGEHVDEVSGSWKRLGPDPVPCHRHPRRNPAESWLARVGHAVFSVVGFVCAILTVVSCVWLLGPIGVISGVIGHRRGEGLGKWAALASAAATAIALVVIFQFAPRH